jgi:murein DD-endopeptidase MepM/ murein hydrolase activator NlpD
MAAIRKDSFYFVLFLCLVVLATTAIWVTRRNIEYFSRQDIEPGQNLMQEEYQVADLPEPQDQQTIATEQPLPGSQETAEEHLDVPEVKTEPVTKPEPVKETAVVTTPSAPKPPVKDQRMVMPVLGKITMDYGKDNLVYSNTLDQWTTHYGIDIASNIGTPVKAAMAGTVSDIANDPALGIVITIDHGNGLVTRYANLQNNNMVEEGQYVEKGKIISGVGATAEFEIADPAHLHFEVIKNGEHQDPKLYLPNM